MDTNPIIRKALFWARRGRKKAAVRLLRDLLVQEPNNAKTWFVLAGIVANSQEIKQCLTKVIELEPENEKARSLLSELKNGTSGQRISFSSWRSLIPFLFLLIILLIFLTIILGNTGFLYEQTQSPEYITKPHLDNTSTFTTTQTIMLAATIAATNTLPPTKALTPTPPSYYLIENIAGQPMKISLDCESNSAVIFARYYGIEIDEVSFFINLPVSDNPNKGFVGDGHDEWGNIPPSGYGVYPAPIVAQLEKYGVQAKDVYGLTLIDLKDQIAANNPVIVWVIGRVERGKASEYTSSDGETNLVARYQHTVIVIGYDETTVTILDGDKTYTRTYDEFLNSWNVLGNMAVIKSN